MTSVFIYGLSAIAMAALIARAVGEQQLLNKRNNMYAGNFEFATNTREISVTNKYGEVLIPCEHFEEWLRQEGRLQWVEDFYDHFSDMHQQRHGSFSMNQYWNLDDKEIHKDIHCYLKKYL